MDVRNCRKCGRIFNYVSGPPICPQCKDENEKKFIDVKKYVQENKGSGIPQIAEECDIEIAQIHTWIREERLFFSEDSTIGIECENCGTMIRTGRFCEKCKNEMTKSFNPEPAKREPPKKKDTTKTPAKMRYL